MNLKDAFRYMNYLKDKHNAATNLLYDNTIVMTTKETHLRNKKKSRCRR